MALLRDRLVLLRRSPRREQDECGRVGSRTPGGQESARSVPRNLVGADVLLKVVFIALLNV